MTSFKISAILSKPSGIPFVSGMGTNKQAQNATKKARRKMAKAVFGKTLMERNIALGMARVAVQKAVFHMAKG